MAIRCPKGKVHLHVYISASVNEMLRQAYAKIVASGGDIRGGLSKIVEDALIRYLPILLAGDARAHTQECGGEGGKDVGKHQLNTVSNGGGGAPAGAPDGSAHSSPPAEPSSRITSRGAQSRTLRNLSKIVSAIREAGFDEGGEIPESRLRHIITCVVGGDRRTIMKYTALLFQHNILTPLRRRLRTKEWIWGVVRLEAPDGIRS